MDSLRAELGLWLELLRSLLPLSQLKLVDDLLQRDRALLLYSTFGYSSQANLPRDNLRAFLRFTWVAIERGDLMVWLIVRCIHACAGIRMEIHWRLLYFLHHKFVTGHGCLERLELSVEL